MYAFKRSNLFYKDYSWSTTEGDTAKIKGFPDDVLLNRHEGYEVIYFINRFISNQSAWSDLSDDVKNQLGVKIEKLIHDDLPGSIRSHKNVYDWIASKW